MSDGRSRRFAIATVVATLFVIELAAWAFFAWGPESFERTRQRLSGEVKANWRLFVPQPYLLYVPGPGYANKAGLQHNEQGYRGEAVPRHRRPGYARVLCMGGSTTYSSRVLDASQSFPAHLQRLIERDKPQPVKGVEVINAGLPSGTSAEILTHWIFKFHHYKPDVVVIHSGGNDAAAMVRPGYQPDYSHWRGPFQVPKPLAPGGRALMSWRTGALFFILLAQGAEPRVSLLDLPPGQEAPARWFEPERDEQGRVRYRSSEIAFLHNLDTAVRLMTSRGVKVLLLPFRAAPNNDYSADMMASIAQNQQVMAQVAQVTGATLVPFDDGVISAGNWLDSCHVNPAGCGEKAALVAPHVKALLWSPQRPAE
jgi:lysophospholipase L1-like esterase